MDELQDPVDDAPDEDQGFEPEAEEETVTDSADLAPADDDEDVDDDDSDEEVEAKPKAMVDGVEVDGPEGFKKAINKQHFKRKEAERKAEALERELNELRASQSRSTEPEALAEVPPLPDPWADDFEARALARDAVIQRNAEFKAQASIRARNEADTLRSRQAKETERVRLLESKFTENTRKLGQDEQHVAEAASAVASYGVSPEIAGFLMEDPKGPLLVQYLASNPVELDALVNANGLEAGMLLSALKQRAATKPKTSKAPPPATKFRGSPQTKNRGPVGAKFE